MSGGVDALVALLVASGGDISHYDERLEAFERDGALQAALDAGRVVRTPIGYELPTGNDEPFRWSVASVAMALVTAVIVLLIVGESLGWWNVFPENPRRGDWRIGPR